ncbi:MAG TPA: tetratricopeptide repeat protein [Caulobacteraceae bacterium]|nr:tetratricopeptide repeat protein [Caulobacteraceae bacterium]
MSSSSSLLETALARHQAGDRDGAERLYRAAAKARPDDPTPLYLMGLARFEAGDPAAAERLLSQVTRLRPDHADARFTLAGLRHWSGDHAAAAADYRAVLALAPDHAGAQLGLAQSLQAAGALLEALGAADAALALAPAVADAHMARAASLAGLGRLDEAAAACARAAALAPGAAGPQVLLASTLLALQDTGGALAAAEAAVARGADLVEAWLALGAALRASRRPGEALAALDRAVALAPGRAAAHRDRGLALAELERLDEAEGALHAALRLAPDDAEAHANLSSVYALGGRPAEAERHARRAIELDPGLICAHQNLAALLGQAGDDEGARAHRDAAYGRRNLLVVTAARPERRVLVLNTTESGNIPDRYLIPAERYTRILWFIEYATAAQMTALPEHDVVFNGIGDPDLAGPTQPNVTRFLEICAQRVVNHPARIARTGRDDIPRLLEGLEGVLAPRTTRLAPGEGSLAGAAAAAGIEAPLLVRPAGAHGGDGLRLVLPSQTAELAATCARPLYLTRFHDFAGADGLHRKYRAIFIDRRPHAYHLAIAPEWLVHYERAGMRHDRRRLAEELRFLEDPAAAIGADAWAAVAAIGARLDLDFCGLDFSVLADGRVLVFEANATMLVHLEDRAGPLAHKNRFVEPILAAFRELLTRAE